MVNEIIVVVAISCNITGKTKPLQCNNMAGFAHNIGVSNLI